MSDKCCTKVKAMRENPEVFKGFMKAVKRGEYLEASVLLCDDCVKLILFKLDGSKIGECETGIASVTNFPDYTEEYLQNLNDMLDARAKAMKDKWQKTYAELDKALGVPENDYWAFNLRWKDYAVLEHGHCISTIQRYRLPWSLEGVKSAADYIAECLVPDLEEDPAD